MSDQIYNLVYCSSNQIRGSITQVNEAVQQILVSARVNNARLAVTGALLFSEGLFAQSLEGPRDKVLAVFRKIECDPRHNHVMVVERRMQGTRSFPNWSMAFTPSSESSRFQSITPIFEKAFANPSEGGREILALLHRILLEDDQVDSLNQSSPLGDVVTVGGQ